MYHLSFPTFWTSSIEQFSLLIWRDTENQQFSNRGDALRSSRCLTGPFTQAIFVAATRCNFCRAKVATSFKHVLDCEQSLFSSKIRGKERKISKRANVTVSVTWERRCCELCSSPRIFGEKTDCEQLLAVQACSKNLRYRGDKSH